MRRMLYVQSRTPGALVINGQFCGPLEGMGQAFPADLNAEIYMQHFPFSREAPPLTVALQLTNGQITRLEPQDGAYALLWPDGIIQLELMPLAAQTAADDAQEQAAAGVLLRYLSGRLAGDAQAATLLMRAQDAPDLTGYEAVVPLRFAPVNAPDRFDERAGLLHRLAPNMARVDAALAATVPVGQGRRLIERIEIMRTGNV